MLSKEKTADTTEIGDFFKKTGMVRILETDKHTGRMGSQLQVRCRPKKEGTFCDHHCAAEGKYVCPAAFFQGRSGHLAPTEAIVEGIKTCGTALRMSREIFLMRILTRTPQGSTYQKHTQTL